MTPEFPQSSRHDRIVIAHYRYKPPLRKRKTAPLAGPAVVTPTWKPTVAKKPEPTAVFITTDEAGGYWDTGYIQPLDFFGDGPRIQMITVSSYSRGGRVVHSYTDHVSILKFIEANWHVGPISGRSRDNLPNPVQTESNPYVPVNSPAIGDLMDMFDFEQGHDDGGNHDD